MKTGASKTIGDPVYIMMSKTRDHFLFLLPVKPSPIGSNRQRHQWIRQLRHGTQGNLGGRALAEMADFGRGADYGVFELGGEWKQS